MWPQKDECDGVDVTLICICPTECCCQRPEPENGVALSSEECPIHNYLPRPHPECPIHGQMSPTQFCTAKCDEGLSPTVCVDPNQLELLFPDM